MQARAILQQKMSKDCVEQRASILLPFLIVYVEQLLINSQLLLVTTFTMKTFHKSSRLTTISHINQHSSPSCPEDQSPSLCALLNKLETALYPFQIIKNANSWSDPMYIQTYSRQSTMLAAPATAFVDTCLNLALLVPVFGTLRAQTISQMRQEGICIVTEESPHKL